MAITEQAPQEQNADVARKPAELEGRVDALDNGRLFGWVWNAADPADRMTVQIAFDGIRIATAVADKARVDLKRNGIGDGAYAFDVELPEEVVAEPDRLSVKAIAPGGEESVLRMPTSVERAAEAAMTVPLSRILDRLDRLIVAQRQLQKAQYESGRASHKVAEDLDALLAADSGLSEAVDVVRKGHGQFASRLEELDVFLMRFDASLKNFDDRLKALVERSKNDQRPHLLLLAAIVGLMAGIGVSVALF